MSSPTRCSGDRSWKQPAERWSDYLSGARWSCREQGRGYLRPRRISGSSRLGFVRMNPHCTTFLNSTCRPRIKGKVSKRRSWISRTRPSPSLEMRVQGKCNIERINHTPTEIWLRSISRATCRYSDGIDNGEEVTENTESYLTLISSDGDEAFTTRIHQRTPRADVAEYYKLPVDEALWSGIRSSAQLSGVRPGGTKPAST